MNVDHINHWLNNNPLQAIEVDCATTVMLKILDGKCKMNEAEKVVMALLYEAVKNQTGELFGKEMHLLISDAKANLTEEMKNLVYEQRLLAETQLSRPVMKKFKAMLRQTGLLEKK